MTPRRGLALACGLAVVAIVISWLLRWGTDDAYISFVYARSLVHGHGLTWFGTDVEGYTNFAWVLWSAIGIEIGANPLWWAWGASLAALGVALVTTYRIAVVRATPSVGLVAILILATNFTFLAFGTSGLETMLQTALLASAWLEVERLRRAPPQIEGAAVLSLIAALALWTRLDSAPILLVLAAVAIHRFATAQASIRTWIALVMPAFVLFGGWFLWKVATYGDVLPNTFYVKAGTGSVAHGAWFAWQFLHAYLLWPLLAGAIVIAVVKRRASLPLALVAAQLAYVIAVGGDFMEFRFFVPLLPPLALALAEAAPPRALAAIGLVAFTTAFSLRHAFTFQGAEDHSIDSIHVMATFFGKVRDNDWSLGTSLHDLSGASIACNGAGAIPYNSELPTIDQLGLNDAWVARHGARPPVSYPRPGHQRFATYEYLQRRGVTFVLGSPTLVPHGALARAGTADRAMVDQWLDSILGFTRPPAGAYEIYAAPVDADRDLLLWYLTPQPAITTKIADWDHLRIARD